MMSSTIMSGALAWAEARAARPDGGLVHLESLVAQRRGHRVDDRRLVVDHQDPLLDACHPHRSTSRTSMAAPAVRGLNLR